MFDVAKLRKVGDSAKKYRHFERFFVCIILILNKMLLHLPLNYEDYQVMAKNILLILLLMSSMLRSWAQAGIADDIVQLQKEMYQLYNKDPGVGSPDHI